MLSEIKQRQELTYIQSEVHEANMNGHEWLQRVSVQISEKLDNVDVSWPDETTVGLSRGLRVIVVHTTDECAYAAPSLSKGGAIAERLVNPVQNLEVQSFAITSASIQLAVEAFIMHLDIQP